MISIRSATAADMAQVGRISHYAFRNHAWTRSTYPVEDAKGNIARYIKRHSQSLDDPKNIVFVAVSGSQDDSEAPVVGYAKWTIHPKARPESEWKTPYESSPVPDGARQDASDVPGEALHALRLKVYKGDPLVFLNYLIVHPDHQRRGIGSRLLQWGLRKSEEMKLPAYLESTEEGYGCYYRAGFRTVDEMTVDTARWGVSEPIHLKCMKYEPAFKAEATS